MTIVDKMPKERRGRPRKYPWAEWTNGEIWEVKKGEDFSCVPNSFRNGLYGYARKRFGLSVEASLKGDTVTFRFWRELQDG